ncbi:DA1-related 1 [Spatholobus suberectus]|nr:DA1-related 1 [Spatholobus suberectus]
MPHGILNASAAELATCQYLILWCKICLPNLLTLMVSIPFSTSEGYPHHILCLKKIHHPKCDVCKRKIPTNPATGQVNYGTHQFWNQKFCPSRIDDGTPRCCSCERLEPQEAGYVDLGDGRKLCLECLHYAILDTNECQPLYMDIQKFYEGLDMKLDEQIPLFLVERQALNKARAGEKNGQHDMLEIETRGVCLSEELTISTISKKPGLGTRNRTVDMRTQPHKLTRHCEVTAILILYGLPRLLTGSILAHEMMHAWFRLHGYRKLNRVVEEGICQVLAHMWLEHELSSSASGSNFVSASSSPSSNEFERIFGKFCKNIIESDITPFYGVGFRAAQNAVRKNGLQKTLHHIRMTRNLPI